MTCERISGGRPDIDILLPFARRHLIDSRRRSNSNACWSRSEDGKTPAFDSLAIGPVGVFVNIIQKYNRTQFPMPVIRVLYLRLSHRKLCPNKFSPSSQGTSKFLQKVNPWLKSSRATRRNTFLTELHYLPLPPNITGILNLRLFPGLPKLCTSTFCISSSSFCEFEFPFDSL